MFSFLSETDDSTTVNYSSYGRFLPGPSAGKQLLTIGAKHLRLFRTNPYALIPPSDGEDWIQKTKLECVFSTRLLGAPKSAAHCRIPNCSSDVLVLAFDDAKVSIVAVDEHDRTLRTLSLHSFEDDYIRDGNTKNFPPPLVKSDPSNRCAALLSYGKNLAVFPFLDGKSHIRSFNVSLKSIDPRLDNVVDMVFLDGYYEPTILFLYEPMQTTAGRASIRYDTMCIMGVSVNLIDHHFAVVWQLANLPMDGNRLLAVPKPVGGAVVFGPNDIIYLNQSVPPCGVSLNGCYDQFTKFPLKDLKSTTASLDCCTCEWVGNGRILIGCTSGRLFSLKLMIDSANSVKQLTVEHIFDVSIPYTITACASGHLFVGSRLGDSQLLRYNINAEEITDANGEVPDSKKPKLDFDEEDFDLYGDDLVEKEEVTAVETVDKWSLEILDSLVNIGPIKSITSGGAHGTSSILLEDNRMDPVFDMVAASGHGKDGSLCVLQRTLRPEIITSSTLESAQHMWAVGQMEDGSHKYLIVSRTRSTLVLELGDEMVELEDDIFVTSEPTVAAGELADGALVVQVTSMCLALVADGQQLQELELDSNFPVIAASIVDPYVALLTQNGKLLVFKLQTQPEVCLEQIELETIDSNISITAMSIYKDMSGMMQCSLERSNLDPDAHRLNGKVPQRVPLGREDDDLYNVNHLDAEDLLLYGESNRGRNGPDEVSKKRKRGGAGLVAAATGGEESNAVDPNTVTPTYWLFLARDSGKIIIHSLPDFTIVFQARKFCGLPDRAYDMTEEEDEKEKKDIATEKERRAKAGEDSLNEQSYESVRQDEKIVELQVMGMGISQCRPVLMMVVDDMVVFYEMFSTFNQQIEHLCIGFRRQALTICTRSSPYLGMDGRRNEIQHGRDTERSGPLIYPFERISSIMHGVLISGAFPCMVFFGAWGGLRQHPLTMDGSLRSYTSFNNQNVANGFLYLTELNQELRIAKLQNDFNYDLPFPCKKVHVGDTVHQVRYMMHSQIYAVTTSHPRETNKIWVVVNDDKQEETHEKSEDFVLPQVPQYKLNLYSPEDWGPVPNTEILMEPLEHITCCEEVALRSESTMSGLQTYLAIGTINNYGEEHCVRGRIIVSEIIEVVPEPGLPTSKHKIKKIYDAEQKGPISALCALNGFLLTALGSKIFIWGFKDNELQGISFLDMHYYVNSLVGLRNIALAVDMQSSLSLIRFQEQFKALSIASKDDRMGMQPPLQTQYLLDNNHMGFVLSDEASNICIFNYLPEVKESVGGERLILRAIINIGTNVNAFIRIRGHTSLCGVAAAEAKVLAQQQTTVWGSLDGSFGFVRPISEKTFRRLSGLYQIMTSAVKHDGGLNPKGSRAAKPPRPVINAANHKCLVDGDIVNKFLHLSTSDKQDISRRLGASRYHIIDDLVQIQRLSTYY